MRYPITAVIPGAQGRVLQALLGSGREMSTSDVARVADISQPHASRVLSRLVELGIVRRRHVPPSLLHQPVPGNAVVVILESLRALPRLAIEHLRSGVQRLTPAPDAAVLFGSMARGTATVDSDIDVLLVRPDEVDQDEWAATVSAWAEEAGRFIGNPVNLIEIATTEWRGRRDEAEGLFAAIRAEGIDLLCSAPKSEAR